jgi:MFS family permease
MSPLPPASANQLSGNTKVLGALLAVNFIGALGLSLVLPFLVFIVRDYGGGAVVYGVLGAMYPLFQLAGAPLLGRWSDSIGRRKVLLLSQGGTLLSWLVFAAALRLPPNLTAAGLALPLVLIFAARAFDGLTGGNVAVANAYLADLTTEQQRKKYYGWMSAAANVGFIVGPALAGLLGGTALGYQLPIWAAAAVSVAGLGLIALGLPKVESKEEFSANTPWRKLVRLPGVGYLLLLYFLIFLDFNVFYTAFPLHAENEAGLNWSAGQLGTYFAVLSAGMILVQGPLMSRIGHKFSDKLLIFTGLLLLSVCFILLRWREPLPVWAAIPFFALGNGIMWPSVLSHLSQLAGKQHQGAVQGLAGSAGGAASVLGLLAGGFLYDSLQGYTFWLTAGLLGLVAILSRRIK